MSDAEEPPNNKLCSVCLESLPPPRESAELLATLPCGHSYHDLCIATWAERTNSCPSCRAKFHEIVLRREYLGAPVRTVCVADKEAPRVESAEEEHEQLAREYAQQLEEPFGDIENCVICASGEREHELLLCDGCDRTFHITCLGLGEVPFSDWFCPTCEVDGESSFYRFANETAANGFDSCEDEVDDYDQDCNASYGRLIESIIRDFERPRPAPGRRRRAPAAPWRRRGARSARRAFAETREQVRRARQQTRQIAAATTSSSISAPVEPPAMSREEVEAWEMLEKAQHLEESTEESTSETATATAPATAPATSPATSSATVPATTPAPVASGDRKLKRPTRKSKGSASATSSADSTLTDPASSSTGGSSSLVKSLLTNIRNSESSSVRLVGTAPSFNTLYSSVSSPEQSRAMSLSPPESRAMSLSPESRAEASSPPSINARDSVALSSEILNARDSVALSSEIPALSLDGHKDIPRSPLRHATTKRLPAWARPRSNTVGSARPIPAAASNSLSLEQKERVQSLVRDALRPMYRSGKIDKAQYTHINKRVSRQMYERLCDLACDDLMTDTTCSNDLSRYKDVVRDFVMNELEEL